MPSYIPNSYIEEFEARVYALLHQEGSALIQGVTQESVEGESKFIRLNQVGEAKFIDSSGSQTEYIPVEYVPKRILRPKAFACPIMIDRVDLVKQGLPDIGQLAKQASDSCGKLVDGIILEGIGGAAKTDAGDIPFPETTNTISYKEAMFSGADDPSTIKGALSTAKIARAVQMLRSKYNSGPILCIANNFALASLRADPRAANALFNTVQSFSSGVNSPFAGVEAFLASELVPVFTKTIEPDDPTGLPDGTYDCSYAYVYNMDMIKLGCSMELTLDTGKNAERYFNDVLQYMGMYDCTRLQEEAVIRIEVLQDKIG